MAAAHPGHDPLYLRGVVLVMLAGSFWSLGGILVRLTEVATPWQILSLRSIGLVATLAIFILVRYRSRSFEVFRRAGLPGVLGGLCLGTAFCGWIFALSATTVANAVFILAAAPFASALLAWFLLREQVRRATWITMLIALAGIGIMVAGGISAGALFGNMMALLSMLGFSGFAVALRFGRSGDMLPATCWAGIFTAVLATVMAGDLTVPPRDLTICLAMGAVQIGAGLALFTVGSRYVPAAELALLSLTEVILAPIWVWLGVGEVPMFTTFLGGTVVLAAIAGQALTGLRRKRPPLGAV